MSSRSNGHSFQSPGSSLSGMSRMSPAGPPARGISKQLPIGSPEEVTQSRATCQRHYNELYDYLTLGGEQPPPARNSAREKLTRLTRQQFQELSTDVYDELLRRKSAPDSEPFLPVQDSFHPEMCAAEKASWRPPSLMPAQQARQKLATLPENRYRDLASDVFFELERRYPEFKEDIARLHQSSHPPAASSSAANEVLVPNKSKLVEEEVGMPRPAKTPSPKSDEERYREREISTDPRHRGSESSIGTSRFIGGYGSRGESTSWDHAEQEKEKLRSEYEYKVATMQQRITGLEADLQDARSEMQNRGRDAVKIKELEDTVRQHQQQGSEHATTIRSLQREVEDHKAALSRQQESSQDLSRMRRDLESAKGGIQERDEVIDDLRKEVKGLLDELRSMNGRHEEIMGDRQRDQEAMRQLEGQATSYRQRYESVKTELRNMKATSGLFVQPPQQNDFLPASDEGAIADIHITAFQSAIDSLLVAGRSGQPTSVLPITKQVVFAVAKLDEDITDYESRRPHGFSEEDTETLQALKAKCNATLSNLVTASKNHAASMGISPVSLLDAAASHLSVTVVDLAKLVRIRKATREELAEGGRPLPSPLPQTSPGRGLTSIKTSSPPRANGTNGTSPTSRVDVLRRAHSPTSSRGSPISPVPPASGNYGINGVSRPREDPLDYGHDRHPSDARYNAGLQSSARSSPVNTNAPPMNTGYQSTSRGGEESRGRPGGYTPEYAQGRDGDDHYGPSPDELDHEEVYGQENGYDNRQNYEELREYCEQQTESIVHSIQSLLAAVRSGASGEEIHENLTSIITVVSSIINVTKDNMPPHARREGSQILGDLTESCDKLTAMQAASHESFSKETKQKLASVSFGAAKALKALNSFLAREAIDN